MGMQQIRKQGAAAAAVIGLGALLVGCSRETAGTQFAASAQGAPVSVSCEPNQRAVVRQAAVNGVMQSQVACESAMAPVGMTGTFGTAAYPAPAGYQAVGYNPGYVDANAPTQYVRTTYPAQPVTRVVAPQPRRVTSYQTERVQPKRSVKKSAIIIGASAGAGAGIGAAIGGKKGAGIGALIGGGGAALWDQITRRK